MTGLISLRVLDNYTKIRYQKWVFLLMPSSTSWKSIYFSSCRLFINARSFIIDLWAINLILLNSPTSADATLTTFFNLPINSPYPLILFYYWCILVSTFSFCYFKYYTSLLIELHYYDSSLATDYLLKYYNYICLAFSFIDSYSFIKCLVLMPILSLYFVYYFIDFFNSLICS